MNHNNETLATFVNNRNQDKHLFTAGPASLLVENLAGLRPCFGRGDSDYDKVENDVLNRLKNISGHSNIVRMQGSASLALEVMSANFLHGRVLIVESGYYSERLHLLALSSKNTFGHINDVDIVDWKDLNDVKGQYDWVVSCYTETSCALKLPIEKLRQTSDRLKAKLMLDATASIGLESGHDLANVIAYSSCKGLFGLTGAAFIAYNELPSINVDSFYLSFSSHLEKKMTGPYHAISSLYKVLPEHEKFAYAVKENKRIFQHKMKKYLSLAHDLQPFLCTHVKCRLGSQNKKVVFYEPRSLKEGSVVCHLGEIHLGEQANGEIFNELRLLE